MRKTRIFIIFIFLPFFHAHCILPADTVLLSKHINALSKTDGYRNYKNLDILNEAAAYIYNCFSLYADTVYYQDYDVKGTTYKNVICSFGPSGASVIVIGAHYDVAGNQQGADDNASGVAGLLELARMLKGEKLNFRIEIVAYSLEEPPYFKTEFMGSYVHARSLYDKKAHVYGMICFDLIGYFSDEKKSQKYPLPLLSLIYGRKGNFITLVNKFCKGPFARRFTRKFRHVAEVRTKKFSGPKFIAGIDFSDHRNYWELGYSATFITNTAFYRNNNYHTAGDIPETLDYKRMAQVIDAVYDSILLLKKL